MKFAWIAYLSSISASSVTAVLKSHSRPPPTCDRVPIAISISLPPAGLDNDCLLLTQTKQPGPGPEQGGTSTAIAVEGKSLSGLGGWYDEKEAGLSPGKTKTQHQAGYQTYRRLTRLWFPVSRLNTNHYRPRIWPPNPKSAWRCRTWISFLPHYPQYQTIQF